MNYDFDKFSRELLVKKYAGGKGYSLFQMVNNGIPVPYFRILGCNAFADFIRDNGLRPQIDQLIKPLRKGMTIGQGNRIHQKIQTLFLDSPFPADVEMAINRTIADFNRTVIAVRSSAVGEDGSAHSFAGQLMSYLYLNDQAQIKNAIKKCWASAYTGRCLAYRNSMKLSNEHIEIAVILQEMIDPDVSGVMFTQNALNGKPREVLINAVYGAGEGLVSGALDADTFWVERSPESIVEEIAHKKERFVADPENPGHCRRDPVNGNRARKSSMHKAQIQALVKFGLIIEDLFQFPQDIEFALKNGILSILQSRPITTITNQAIYQEKGRIRIWDNSNIVESYSGVISPLTFSFASYAYEKVYTQLCEVMGVSQDLIQSHADIYENMIGLIDGHVYYNLINWYRLLSLFPAFKHNQSAMETMMGVKESLPAEVADALMADVSNKSPADVIERLKVGCHLIKYHLTINKLVKHFFERFWSLYDQYNAYCYRRMDLDQIVAQYKKLRRDMLHNWQVPLINDFLTMIHFSLLKKLSEEWCRGLGNNLHNDLLSGEGGIESAEPTRKIVEFSAFIVKDKKLRALFDRCDEETIYEELQRDSDFEEFNAEIERYLQKYGFRCMGELRLEATDLNSDPCHLFTMIKNYIRSGQTDYRAFLKSQKKLRKRAEEKIDRHLTGYKKVIFQWVLKHARNTVKHRENLRFARTRVFGLSRTMFQAIGADLTRKNLLVQPADVFYLTVDELIAFSEGRATLTNLKGLCELRKEEFNAHKDKDEPDDRFYTRGVIYQGNEWNNKISDPDRKLPRDTLKGLPCCPGNVAGTAKVILSQEDDLALNGEILATSRTDPGWVPLFPSISGLLIERGSLLSHSAIVARELGVPTIIKVNDLLDHVHTGDKISMDGSQGIIRILRERTCEIG